MRFDPIKSLSSLYSDSRHVLSVSYRPDADTFKRTLKIVVIGILILGVLGYVISIIVGLVG